MEKPSLLGDSSDSDVEFGINEEFAKSYDKRREKEVVQHLKDKYGDISDLSSSSSESEDYEPPKVDESFYKALSLVKSRDSKMYEINNTVVPVSEVKPEKAKVKKPKPLYFKDYERKVALETGGQLSDYEDENMPEKKLGYDEEQEKIKKSFMGFDLSEDDDDASDILNVRTTTKAEQKKSEEDYVAYLKGETQLAKEDQAEKKDLSFLRSFWNDPKLSEDEKFLRDYFLNAKYEEEEDKSETVPTYEDITNDVDAESYDGAAQEFEEKYNFRFEEPDSEFIKRYPRTMKDCLRKKDERRKTKREERAERKTLEKLQKREEIKFLKALKRKEIEEKLTVLKETLHDENVAFEDVDLEGDFDPAEHDQKMSKLFSDQYYEVPEGEKPSFPEDEDLDFEDWDNWTGNDDTVESDNTNDEDPQCEDPDFNKDAESEDPKLAFQKEMIGASKPRSKKKKSYFASAISKKKPVFDPSGKTFEQYLNEYYQLDCEDFIGELPTRFRYREVVPNDFGLSVNEILSAEDRELNQWCSLKRVCQNRAADEELYDVQAYKQKAQNEEKKKKIFTTLYSEPENDSTEKKTKKHKKKKEPSENDGTTLENEGSSQSATAESAEQGDDDNQSSAPNSDKKMKKKKKKKNKNVGVNEGADRPSPETSHDPEVSPQASTGDIPSYKSSKRKYVEEQSDIIGDGDSLNTSAQSHKKKKRKLNEEGSSEFQAHNSRNGEASQFTKSRKKKHGKHKPCEVADKRLLLSDKRLEAYGINPKKFKNKIKFSNK